MAIPGIAGDDVDPRTRPLMDRVDLAQTEAIPPARAPESAVADLYDLLGGDPVILGSLEDGDAESLLSDRTGSFLVPGPRTGVATPAPVYLSSALLARLHRDAVPVRTHDALGRRDWLDAFEQPVFDLIDGRRTLEDLRIEAGMSENDIRVALALLLEKAMIDVTAPLAEGLDDATRALSDAGAFEDRTRELDNLPPLSNEGSVAPHQDPGVEPLPAPPGTQEVFDDLVMVPLPVPSPPSSPWSTSMEGPAVTGSEGASPDDAFQVPRSDAVAAARPAMRVTPMRARARPTPMPPSSPRRIEPAREEPEPQLAYKPKAGLTLARAGGGPTPPTRGAPPGPSSPPGSGQAKEAPRAISAEARARGAQFYEMCMKDLREGRAGRAWGYAKMAVDADPDEEKYRLLLADWGKMVGGASAQSLGFSTPPQSAKELLEASQAAEQAGDFETAVAHARKLCEVAPSSAAAFNRLSVLLATRLKDYKGAYNAAHTAVELDGNNLTFQSNMMKILAKLETGDDQPKEGGSRGGLMGKLLGK